MNESKNQLMDGLKNEWMDGLINECMKRWMHRDERTTV